MCILILSSVLPNKNVCLSNGSHKMCLSINKYAFLNEWLRPCIYRYNTQFFPCRWSLRTTQYLCEHTVKWTCKDIFFGLCDLAQIVFFVSTTNSESSSSEIIPLIPEAPFCTWDLLMTLFLYRAQYLSQTTSSSCTSLLISFENISATV